MSGDIFRRARELYNPSVIEFYFPGGKWKKDEYWICSPLRPDKNPNSFSISEKGLYKDFASDDSGDLIDLISRTRNITQHEAAEIILKDHSSITQDQSVFYKYFDKDKKLVFAIHRKIKNGSKTFYFEDINGNWKEPEEYKKENSRPLFRLPEILKNTDNPILLVEGEKSALIQIDNFILTTFSGGSKRYSLTDFSPLYGRKIYLWPDNDETGKSAMEEIGKQLKENGSSVLWVEPPAEKPKGWDIADASKNEIENLLTNAEKNIPSLSSRFNLKNKKDIFSERPPVKWLIENFMIENSLCMITGDAGSGKTWTALDIAVCISEGIDWLDFKTIKGNVLIIDEESGDNRLSSRLKKIIKGHEAQGEDNIFYMSMDEMDIRNAVDISELEKIIIENKIKFVVIDSLMEVILGADENSVKDVLPALKKLKQMTEHIEVTFLLIHHNDKGDKGYRGTTAIKGAVDLLFEVKKTENSDIIKFKTVKIRDGEPLDFQAKMIFTDFSFFMEKHDGKEIKLKKEFTNTELKIINFLANNPDSDKHAIHEDVKGNLDTIKNVLTGLLQKEILVNNSANQKGSYSIHPEKHLELRDFIKNDKNSAPA